MKLPSEVLRDTKCNGRFDHDEFRAALETFAGMDTEAMKAELSAARAAGRFDSRFTAAFWKYTTAMLGTMAALSMMRTELRAAIVEAGFLRQ